MNIRSPRHIDDLILRVQDEYLKGVADEHGIIEVMIFLLEANVFQSGKGISLGYL